MKAGSNWLLESENVLRLKQSFGKLLMVLELNWSLEIGLVLVKLWVHEVSVGVAENLVLVFVLLKRFPVE